MAGNMGWVARALPAAYEDAAHAEEYLRTDPRAAAFYARRCVERIVEFIYATRGLEDPYRTDLSGLINGADFTALAGQPIVTKLNFLRKAGNNAVHRGSTFDASGALVILRELFHVLVWTAFHHGPHPDTVPTGDQFNPALAPQKAAMSVEQLDAVIARLKKQDEDNARLRKQNEQQAAAYEAEIQALREQITAAQAAATTSQLPDLHEYDYAEAETRTLFIDLLLAEAGWPLDQDRDREYPVTGLPTADGTGRVDYVLWGADGLPLAVVEAKRTTKSALEGQEQARRYADALQDQFGRRPLIFYTNGYDHWFWDDTAFGTAGGYPPREVEGFFTADELELLIQRRTTRQNLADVPINVDIAGRPYQLEAISAAGQALSARQRDALLVMATGTGKTRTAIALVDQLVRANWVKRVLFLADRTALVRQAKRAFAANLPDTAVVNLQEEKHGEGRVYTATYPTMLNLLQRDGGDGGARRFGAGYFDLVVIDEAHRSVYQKYKAIFDWFDSLLLGLTATPKDEVDHNTYRLFNIEDGVPTFAFDLEEAVEQGYLVPPVGVTAGTEFLRRGIRYDDLSEDEKAEWDALDWGEDGPPDSVDSEQINRYLFNEDTVDKVLEMLMEQGQKVAGGDRLGKTIVFAKNQHHADFIERRFNARFPELGGTFARVITSKTAFNEALLDDFSDPDKVPHIAISVDMLDTGVDIPEVVNLVLFKVVHSKTKFWQMIGRGTRLRPDLFGPGQDKKNFTVFDFGENLAYFNKDLPEPSSSLNKSLTQCLFETRAAVVATLDSRDGETAEVGTDAAVRQAHASWLHAYVDGMPMQNLLVRKHRRHVERWAKPGAWERISKDDVNELIQHVSGLPSALRDADESAKRFDLLTLRWQLATLDGDAALAERCRGSIQEVAGALLSQLTIPAVKVEEFLLRSVAEDMWWEAAAVTDVEELRERLRGLVMFLPRRSSSPVYTDFLDTLGEVAEVEIVPAKSGMNWERYREKATAFLRAEQNTLALQKLRRNEPLTETDLKQLERILLEAGGSEQPELDWVRAHAGAGLGVFVRSLVGLDRSAAEEALSEFLDEGRWATQQIRFTRMLVDDLVRNGVVDPGRLYEDPYSAMGGVDAVYPADAADAVVAVLTDVRARAEVGERTSA